MATRDYAENMSAILRRVGGALIEATPEWWSEATLRVEVQKSARGTSISHSIRSEQHPKDVVVATDDIVAGTRELQLLSESAGESWSAFVMQVRQEGDDWKFNINFEYAA
jgi:hypothetical protein